MLQNRHSEIIKAVCKEILLPLGAFQKGNSRTYLDDNGHYFTVLEFQPSNWQRGTYLNVGICCLWDYKDYLSFSSYGDFRVGKFIAYENDEQFEAEIRQRALLAKEKLLFYRNSDNVKKTIFELYGGADIRAQAMYYAFKGQLEEAHKLYAEFMNDKNFAYQTETFHLPTQPEELTYDFVMKNIKETRALWRSKPSMKNMQWYEKFDSNDLSQPKQHFVYQCPYRQGDVFAIKIKNRYVYFVIANLCQSKHKTAKNKSDHMYVKFFHRTSEQLLTIEELKLQFRPLLTAELMKNYMENFSNLESEYAKRKIYQAVYIRQLYCYSANEQKVLEDELIPIGHIDIDSEPIFESVYTDYQYKLVKNTLKEVYGL